MINLNTNITQPNVNRWQVLAFDIANGLITLRFWAPANTLPSPPWIDVVCRLSNEANKSLGPLINPAPSHWDDKIVSAQHGPGGTGGSGAANSLTNAQNAYRSAANHNAGLRAVEGQGITDGWIPANLGGS